MSENKMILIAAVLTIGVIAISPDGFFGRWCSAYPEFCEPQGEQYAISKQEADL